MTEPTDKSMPPVMITSIMPIDMMAISENERNTPIRLLVVRKYGEKMLMRMPTSSSTDRIFSSRIFSHRRSMSADFAADRMDGGCGCFFEYMAPTDVSSLFYHLDDHRFSGAANL